MSAITTTVGTVKRAKRATKKCVDCYSNEKSRMRLIIAAFLIAAQVIMFVVAAHTVPTSFAAIMWVDFIQSPSAMMTVGAAIAGMYTLIVGLVLYLNKKLTVTTEKVSTGQCVCCAKSFKVSR